MKVHLIHGIHATRPGGNTSRLKPYFEAAEFEVVVHSYGWLPGVLARFRNETIAERIARTVQPDDILLGHSNGAALIEIVVEKHQPVSGVVLVNPALDADAALNDAGWVDVYHNDCDSVVVLSSLLLFNRWGPMGRTGASCNDGRFRNFDCTAPRLLPPVCGHSALFDAERLLAWGPAIVTNVKERMLK